jgi:precorrin-2 dehydrogenase/sirohydrochlorin ferrochelatase
MIPVALDPKFATVAVAGNGELALRRLTALRRAGAAGVLLYADAPMPALREAAGEHLRPAMPTPSDIAALHALWIVDVAPARASEIAAVARRLKVLVNVEDVPAECDFHSVAEVRRGDLLLTVSTNGAAPGVAGAIRRGLERCYGPEWAERMDELRALRRGWRADGVTMPEAARRLDEMAAQGCWINCPKPA